MSLLSRRAILAALAPAVVASGAARADMVEWPKGPVRYINGYPAGGSTDTLSRLFCARMAELTGHQFVVENRSGSGGVVGAEAIARARPDGQTIGLGGIAPQVIAPSLNPSLPFDPARDFTYISGLWRLPNLLVVTNELPVHDVAGLIALLKANPGRYSYASAGPGTSLHIAGALLAQTAGVDIQHVPYRGDAPAMVDLIAGRVQMMLGNIPTALAQARQGKVRALGVTSAARSPAAPEVPSIGETLPGFDLSAWTSLCAPAGLPPPIVGRISELAREALTDAGLRRAYLEHGATPWWTTPAEVTAHRAAEQARFRPLVAASGARIE